MAELAHRTPQMPDGKQPVPGAVVRAWGGASCCSVLWLAGDLLQTPSSRRIIEIKNLVLRETYLDGWKAGSIRSRLTPAKASGEISIGEF